MCSLVPLRKAAYVWYRTMTAILLRRERGRNNAEMYAVLVVTPPPLFSAKLRFKRGGVTTREYGSLAKNLELMRYGRVEYCLRNMQTVLCNPTRPLMDTKTVN